MSPESVGPMAGRVVVITGGTSGVGLATARGIAAQGAHVVVVGRGDPRVHQVAAEIRRVTGNPEVEGLPVVDLGLRSEWKRVAGELLRRFSALHVLVNNAGAYYARRETTPEGVERTFALNVLAPLGLTTLLADRLRASAPARVIDVGSAAHYRQVVDLSDLEGTRSFRGFRAYGRSKLELVLLSRELARRFSGTGVTVNCLHPGFIRSGFGQNNAGVVAGAIRLAGAIGGKSLEEGARTPIRLACDPTIASISGEYFSGGRAVPGSEASRDMAMAGRLYEACLPYLGLPPLPEPETVPFRASSNRASVGSPNPA